VFSVHASSPTPTIAELTDTKDEPAKESEEGVILDEEKAEAAHANAKFPDGGWRAWLVVFGVRLPPFYTRDVSLFFIQAMCNTFSTYVALSSLHNPTRCAAPPMYQPCPLGNQINV
jgi:hypothetical protein